MYVSLMRLRCFQTIPWYLVLLGGILCLGIALPVVRAAQQEGASQHLDESPYLRIDPAKIVTSDRDSRIPCGECHKLEYDVWRETPHATGFDLLHRSEQAQSILQRMEFRLSKRESLCLRCHYTATIRNGQARAIAGVSCESCHGAARDWVEVHNDYGGAAHDTEADAHRQQRIARSTENGMLRPSDNLYAVAANCFECHTVPNEKLINTGGHPSGSPFDLLEWSDKIRHNFLPAQWSNDETNRARRPARKRLMFVIGRALNYEYSLRAAAEATETGVFAKAMERKVKVARRDLEKVYRLAPLPDLQAILMRGSDLKIVPNNRAALLAAADAISAHTQRFADGADDAQLAALDPLIAGEPVASAEPEEAETEATAETAAEVDVSPEDGRGTEADAAQPSRPAGPAVAVVGEKRRRPSWFSAPSRATLGPSSGCSCHNDQFAWWDRDKHSQSALPLLNHDPKAVQIAQTYGLSVSQMKRGNQICMNCHGTIVTGEEAEEVFDGVSCESCHGPGEDYERRHQPPKPPPADWSGYREAASLGLINQESPTARADNCVRCHHITEERLLSSGHPTGEGFDLGERSQKIRHWKGPILGAGDLNAAYRQVRQRRPIPQVPIATPVAAAVPPPPVTRRARSSSPQSAPLRVSRPGLPRVRPVDPSEVAPGTYGLVPLPSVSDSTTTEDILLIIKRRLEQLYQALGRGQ